MWQNDRVEIIANDQGNRTTPSYVGFTDGERLIGDAAKNQVAMNPINTVFDAKRLIGRKFSDAAVQSDIKHWPFSVVSGPAEKPMIEGERAPMISNFPPLPSCSAFVSAATAELVLVRWRTLQNVGKRMGGTVGCLNEC